MAALNDADLQQLRQRLLERQAVLSDEVRSVKQEQAEAPGAIAHHQNEDAGELGEEHIRQEVRYAERERDELELRDIDEALDRLDGGAYGECVDCGTDIPLQRLMAQPAAKRCIGCQSQWEQGHPAAPRISASL